MRPLTLLTLLTITPSVFGQYNETIGTDRPGQANGAFTVGKNVLQFQQGVEYAEHRAMHYTSQTSLTNHVIRYGVSERFEWNALVDVKHIKYHLINDTFSRQGLSDLHFGFRVHINDQRGIVPAMNFQLRLKTPGVSEHFGEPYIAPIMTFVANWSLPKDMSISTNWIMSYNGYDAIPTGNYVLNFGFPIHKKWSAFVENYGQIRETEFQTRFDAGFAYLAGKNVQFDLYAGYGDNQGNRDFFVSAGISWRIKMTKKNEDEDETTK